MSHPYKVQRIGDICYTVKFDDPKFKPLIINIQQGTQLSDIDRNQEFFYNLISNYALSIHKSIKEDQKFESRITLGDKEWVIKVTKKADPLLSKFLRMLHKQGQDDIIRLEISRSDSLNPLTLALPGVGAMALKDATNKEDYYNATTLKTFNLNKAAQTNEEDCKAYPNMIPCSKEELSSGIRGKFPLKALSQKEQLQTSFFSHPFTVLSTLAFQRYENEFSGHDKFKPKDCRYCLVLEKDELKLVQASKSVKEQKEIHKATVKYYLQMLEMEYGKERVDLICKRFKINFEKIIEKGLPLTPEHVYRINIGLNQINTSDLKGLLKKLPEFKNAFSEALKTFDKECTIFEVIEKIKDCPLTLSEIRGILSSLKRNSLELTPQNLLNYLQQFEGKNKLTEDLVNQLTQVVFPSAEEYPKVFTGRDIYFPIKAGYTIAEKNEFKPWVDAQELLHILPVIQNTKDWNLYKEKLTHVVCKKHLFHLHPEKGYVAGAIIPAPMSEDGKMRWYKVSQVVHNGYGMLCYTLEPLGIDTKLPLIQLYRSTSSDAYAVFGRKTLRTDTNPLATPGYEGKGRTAFYDLPKINSRTIPLWVAYLLEAKNRCEKLGNSEDLEKIKEILHLLLTATQELHQFETLNNSRLSFKDILLKHSGIINTFYLKGPLKKSFYEKLRDTYLNSDKKNSAELIRKDANEFLDMILPFQHQLEKFEPSLQVQFQSELDNLVKDVNEHLLLDNAERENRKRLHKFYKTTLKKVDEIEKNCTDSLKNNLPFAAVGYLSEWGKLLEEYAQAQKELPESKDKKDIIFVGHSLGGSYAQIYAQNYLIQKGRVPCPGQKCLITAFDAPGVLKEDNEKFKQFIFEHSEILKANNIEFNIYHQHEAGDVIATIGTHLGSASDLNEAGKILLTMGFQAHVMKRNPDAKHPTLAFATIAHGTQFLEGKEGVDYTKKSIDPYELGLMESHETMNQDLPKDIVTKKGQSLRSELWQIPLSPHVLNKIRSNPTLFYLAGNMVSNWVEHDREMVEHLDPYGNFAVDEEGLISKRVAFYPSTPASKPKGGALQTFSEKKLKSFLYPGMDLKKMMITLFKLNLPESELQAKLVEFEKSLEGKKQAMEILGGKRLNMRISSGNLDAMMMSPQNLMKEFAEAGVEKLTVQLDDQISTVYLFDPNVPEQANLLQALKEMKFEEVGWKILKGAKAIIGEEEFVSKITPASNLQILKTEVPSCNPSKAGVMIFGGNFSLYEMHIAEIASFLMRGFSVFGFNPPGYSKSEGTPNQNTLTEASEAAYNLFIKEARLKEEQVLIKTLCMSGGWASTLASLHPKTTLWIDQTYSNFYDFVKSMVPKFLNKIISKQAVVDLLVKMIPETLIPSFDVGENLEKHEGLKCIMYSSEDELIPASHITRNFEHSKDKVKVHLIEIPGKHAQTWYRLKNITEAETKTKDVKEKVDGFLNDAGMYNPLIVTTKIN